MGDRPAALAAYRAALQRHPQYREARIAVSELHRKGREFKEAARSYQEAIALEPKAEVYRNNFAVVLEEWGKRDEAIAACRAALVLNAKYAAARNFLCDLLVKSGRLDEAANECQNAIAIEERNASGHHRLGLIRGRQGRPREAVAEYRRAVELDPDSTYLMQLVLALAPPGGGKGAAEGASRAEAATLLAGYFDRHQTADHGLVAGTFCRAIGEMAGYERIARKVLERYKDTTDYQEIEKAAKLGMLDPAVDGSRLAALTKMAERAVIEGLLREAAAAQQRAADQAGPAAMRRVRLLQLRFQDGLPIRVIAARWGEDAAKLHHEYATARREFRNALRAVVGFHHPDAVSSELDRACAELLAVFA